MVFNSVNFTVVFENDLDPLVQVGTCGLFILLLLVLFPVFGAAVNDVLFSDVHPTLQIPAVVLFQSSDQLHFSFVQGADKLGVQVVRNWEDGQSVSVQEFDFVFPELGKNEFEEPCAGVRFGELLDGVENGFEELLHNFEVLAANEIELIGSDVLFSHLQFPSDEALLDVLVVLGQLVQVRVAELYLVQCNDFGIFTGLLVGSLVLDQFAQLFRNVKLDFVNQVCEHFVDFDVLGQSLMQEMVVKQALQVCEFLAEPHQ
jgi:hypothetical protein